MYFYHMSDVHFAVCPPDAAIATKISADWEVWGGKKEIVLFSLQMTLT